MKVDGNDPIARLKEILATDQTAKPRGANQAKPPQQAADKVELSRTGREFSAIREAALGAPEARTELIERLRESIQTGAYEPDAKTIAKKILEELGGASGS